MDRDSHQNDYYIDSYGNVAKRRQPPSLRKFKEEPLVPIGASRKRYAGAGRLRFGRLSCRSACHPTRRRADTTPGVAATAATLIAAGRQFRKGDAGKMNRFLWWRVYAQGFTVVAMIFGGILWRVARNCLAR